MQLGPGAPGREGPAAGRWVWACTVARAGGLLTVLAATRKEGAHGGHVVSLTGTKPYCPVSQKRSQARLWKRAFSV